MESYPTAPIVPKYDTGRPKSGNVLIITNIFFLDGNTDRFGAETDEENLINMFKNFGFHVRNYRDLQKQVGII